MFIPTDRHNESQAYQNTGPIQENILKSHILNKSTICEIYDIAHPEEIGSCKNHLDYFKKYAKWSIQNQKPTNLLSKNIEYQIDFQVQKMVISPDGNHIAYSLKDNSMMICSRSELFKIENKNFRVHSKPILNFIFSHNSQKLASIAKDQLLLIWNVKKREIIHEIQQTQRNISACSFGLECDDYFAFANYERSLTILKYNSQKFFKRKAHDKFITHIGFTNEDRYLITGSYIDSIVKLWDISRKELKLIQTIEKIRITNLLISNNMFISYDNKKNEIKLWKNLKKNKPLGEDGKFFEEEKCKFLGRDGLSSMYLFSNKKDEMKARFLGRSSIMYFFPNKKNEMKTFKFLGRDSVRFPNKKDETKKTYLFLIYKNNTIAYTSLEDFDNSWEKETIAPKKLIHDIQTACFIQIKDEIFGSFFTLDKNFEDITFSSDKAKKNLIKLNKLKELKELDEEVVEAINELIPTETAEMFTQNMNFLSEINPELKINLNFDQKEYGIIRTSTDPKKKRPFYRKLSFDGKDELEKYEGGNLSPKIKRKKSNFGDFISKFGKKTKEEAESTPYPFYQKSNISFSNIDLIVVSNDIYIATLEGNNNFISIWNIFNKNLVNTISFIEDSIIKFIFFSPDGKCFGAFDHEYVVQIFDSSLKNCLKTINCFQSITSINFSIDNSRLIVSTQDNQINIYDIASDSIIKTFPLLHHVVVIITPLKDNESFLVGTAEGKLMLLKEKRSTHVFEQERDIFEVINFSGSDDEPIKCISMDNNASTIFCVFCSDSVIKHWNLETKVSKELIYQPELKDKHFNVNYTAISLTANGRRVAAGNSKGDIIIWNPFKSEKPFYILAGTHLAPIYSLEFVDNDNALISKSLDCIKKWRLFKDSKILDYVQYLCYSSDFKFVILSEMETNGNNQRYYLLKKDSQKKFLINLPLKEAINPTEKKIVESERELLQSKQSVENLNIKFEFFDENKGFVLALNKVKSSIYFYYYKDNQIEISPKITPIINSQIENLVDLKIYSKENFIIIFGDYNVEIWKKREKDEYVSLPIITISKKIIQTEFVSNYLLILDKAHTFNIIDLNDGRKGTGGLEKIKINYIYPIHGQNSIFILSDSFLQKINLSSHLDSSSRDFPISVENVNSFIISPGNEKRIIYQSLNNDINASVSGFDFKYTYVLKKNAKDANKFFLDKNEDLFVIFKDKKIKRIEKPFKFEKFLLTNARYFSFFYDVLSEKKQNLDSKEEKEFFEIGCGVKGIVIPFYQTFLHKIALISDEEAFDKFCKLIKSEINFDAFFKADINGMNCLEILFQQKNNTFVTKIILYWVNHYKIDLLFKKYKRNLFEYMNFEICNKLIHLFQKDTQLLNKLFTFLFQSPLKTNISLPKLDNDYLFVINDPEISLEVIKELLGTRLKEKNSLEYAVAKVLYVPNATEREYSINQDFLNELTTLEPTNLIFSNEALINLINCKWSAYGKKYFFFEFLFYLLFCLVFIIESSYVLLERVKNDEKDNYYLISYIFDIVLIIYIAYNIYYELYQIIKFGTLSYLSSFWNLINVFLFLFAFAAIVLDFVNLATNDYYFEQLRLLYSISVFFCFIRLLSYARGIKGSAFMIRLILQVFIDIKYFVALISVFIIGLAISGYDVQKFDDDSYSFFQCFNFYFRLLIGGLTLIDDWRTDFPFFLYFLYYIASILLTVIMLNLLIAIIADTYANVTKNEGKTRIYEMCNILSELDSTSLITLIARKFKSLKCLKRYGRESNEMKQNYKFLLQLFNEPNKEKDIDDNFKDLNSLLEDSVNAIQANIQVQLNENRLILSKMERIENLLIDFSRNQVKS